MAESPRGSIEVDADECIVLLAGLSLCLQTDPPPKVLDRITALLNKFERLGREMGLPAPRTPDE